MTFDNPILFFICSIGVFNGFLVSFYFLFFNKEKRTQNSLLGLLLLLLSLRIGKSVYVIFTLREERDITLIQIGLSACFLIGVTLFYYLKASVNNEKKVPNSWKLHFLILFLFISITGYLRSYDSDPEFWNNYFVFFTKPDKSN